MKISWRDQDVLISIGGMRDSFEIDSGIKEQVTFWKFNKAVSG